MSTPGSGSKSRRRASAGGAAGVQPSLQQPPSSSPPSALVFRVVEVDAHHGDFGATLWMPPASMLSASLSASQLVSVSVDSSDARDSLQVRNLEERCSVHFGVVIKNNLKELGSFCVVASAWPCCKLKEGIRLSKQLFCALNCSQPPPQVRLRPITGSGLDHCRGLRLPSTEAIEMNVQECQELVLRLCRVKAEDNLVDTLDFLTPIKGTPKHQPLVSKANEASPFSPANQQLKMETDIVRRQAEMLGSSKSGQAVCPKGIEKKDVPQRSLLLKEKIALSSILGDEDSRAFKLFERLGGRLLNGRYLLKGNFVGITICGQDYFFQVVDARSSLRARSSVSDGGRSYDSEDKRPGSEIIHVPTLFLIGSKTQVKFELSECATTSTQIDGNAAGDGVSAKHTGLPFKRLEYSALGGLSEQILTLKEIIKFSLLQPERLLSLGLQPPHGVLLHGPPGTGKTSLALASATEAGVNIFSIDGPEIVSQYYGESEAALRAVFATAQAASPAVMSWMLLPLNAQKGQKTWGDAWSQLS